MGKIFDALEKANRKNASPVLLSVKPKKSRLEKKSPENVVSLVDANRNATAGFLDKTLIVYHKPKSVEAELFKVLRTNILFPSVGSPPRTILITSALPGEGKSFVSSNLAVSMAQGVEEHVLLIDGDLRKPAIHTRFGFNKVAGLADYLAHGDNIGGALLKTPIDKLTLLPAGEPPANPLELMSSKKMKALLEEVKSRYDDRYVLIDSPPPTMASETNAIAKYVDGVIVVVRAQKTSRDAVVDTIEKLGKEKLIGIVLNQADRSVTKYYGYNKSYYRQE
ncbi:MAG: CpsD/CapB family tyrosine-protein kinase [Desulfobacteraceae bacterium]|jgi:exopolysaccharide/PEP-CTERM locus tyrosine autokinase